LSSIIAVKRKTRKDEAEQAASGANPEVSEDTLEELTKVFKMLSDQHRLKIVLTLAQKGPMNVGDLTKLVGQTQPAVSHHLTLMRIVGLVAYDRRGKHNYYYLASDHLRDLFEQFFAEVGNKQQVLTFDEFKLTYTSEEPA